MSSAQEELREFLHRYAEAMQDTVNDTPPGGDPMPVLLVEGPDEQAAVMMPLDLNDGSLKDVLFGQIVPQMMLRHRATLGAFGSFAWHTRIEPEEGKRVAEILAERGLSRRDTAAVRSVLEEQGITVNDPDRRIEVCTVTAASPHAEAVSMSRVERNEEGRAHVVWEFDEPSKGEPYGTLMLPPGGGDEDRAFSGRVIEGLREGLRRVADVNRDWRNDG